MWVLKIKQLGIRQCTTSLRLGIKALHYVLEFTVADFITTTALVREDHVQILRTLAQGFAQPVTTSDPSRSWCTLMGPEVLKSAVLGSKHSKHADVVGLCCFSQQRGHRPDEPRRRSWTMQVSCIILPQDRRCLPRPC